MWREPVCRSLIAVYQDVSGKAHDVAFCRMRAPMVAARRGSSKRLSERRRKPYLFGEQAVLCGGIVELIKTGFETLVGGRGYATGDGISLSAVTR